jgi:hypothetical protein
MSAAFKSAMATLESIDPSQFANDAERYQVKEAVRSLVVRMETPFERVWALSYENPPLLAGLRIGIDLEIWQNWAAIYEEKGEAELTLSEIVALCNRRPETNLLREYLASHVRWFNLLTASRTIFEAHSSVVPAGRDGP